MKNMLLVIILGLINFSVFSQDSNGWTNWYPIYSEQDKVIQISFKFAQCFSMGNEKFLKGGYSFYRIKNDFERDKCWLSFSFEFVDCDEGIGHQTVRVDMGNSGIEQDLGMWFTGYRVTKTHESNIELKCPENNFKAKSPDNFNSAGGNLEEEEKRKNDEKRIKDEELRRKDDQNKLDMEEQLREKRNEQNNKLKKQTEDANSTVIDGFNQAVMSGEKTEFFDKLGYGMTFGFGMGFVQIPMTVLSTNPQLSPSSSSISTASPLGGYFNSDLWLVRNKYFGVGGDSYMNLGFYTGINGNNQTATIYGFNARIQAGLKKLKLHLQYGTESRTGTVSNDFQYTGGNETGSFSYDINRYGAGIIYDFSNENNGDSFVSYTLLFDRPDFLPKSYEALKVHKLWIRSYIDIIIYYSNNYPIAGRPQYPVDKTNKDFIMISLSKTFTLFKGIYKKK